MHTLIEGDSLEQLGRLEVAVFDLLRKHSTLSRYSSRVVANGDCWQWIGSNNGAGYGEIRIGYRKRYAHRIFYEALVGPIPKGLQLDHLCRNRSCVNPAHLEPVTNAENVRRGLAVGPHPERRKVYCCMGHMLSETEYIRPDGKGRNCSTCVRIRAREYQRRKRAQRCTR